MRDRTASEESKLSRSLSWKTPKKFYYSMKGKLVCPVCSKDVNVRDLLINRSNLVSCKECK